MLCWLALKLVVDPPNGICNVGCCVVVGSVCVGSFSAVRVANAIIGVNEDEFPCLSESYVSAEDSSAPGVMLKILLPKCCAGEGSDDCDGMMGR